MAAPMVKKFFEGIKEDIKDTIAPPKKALIVVDESQPAPAEPAEIVPLDPSGTGPAVEGPLRALPVEPLEAEMEAEMEGDMIQGPPDEFFEEPLPAEPRAIRAIPVGDDEVIQEAVEEP